MTRFEELWANLYAILSAKGLLPHQHKHMTPAEIAVHIHQTGDTRVIQFVWDYYYPGMYGGIAGTLSEEDANALIDSCQTKRPKWPQPSQGENCVICGKRPARALKT